MGYDYDREFYEEPSILDFAIDAFKKEMLDAVKSEYKNKMDQLEKENKELQGVKADFDAIKLSYKKAERELERKKSELMREVRQERLSQLMGDMVVVAYSVDYDYVELPKCDKCDENRRLNYITPLGNSAYENCDCSKKQLVYKPVESILYELKLRHSELSGFYRVIREGSRDEYLTSHSDKLVKSDDLITDDLSVYGTIFRTIEQAQKFCDLINEKNKLKLY